MKIVPWNTLNGDQRLEALQRPHSGAADSVYTAVREILEAVKRDGDSALRRFCHKFDGYTPEAFLLSEAEISKAEGQLSETLKSAIKAAYANITRFHQSQGYRPIHVDVMDGLACERQVRPINSIGLYIPSGTAPLLSTVLMLGIPSQIAGNPMRTLCTPADSNGQIHPAILYAATLCGITRIARVGGAQAIAAMAYGTDSIPKADKIFGPGNMYVTAAKTLVSQEYGGAAIDMPAGPSEVLVIADDTTPAAFAAADLLSQAEHDTNSQVVLIATNTAKAEEILLEVNAQLSSLPRQEIATAALKNSRVIVADSVAEALDISNTYAPEHLILCFDGANSYTDKITNAGSVFLGTYTPESLGDYASGTNHVLPTGGSARAYSGLGVEAFQKTITFQQANKAGLTAIGDAVIELATAETLDAHARAVALRLNTK